MTNNLHTIEVLLPIKSNKTFAYRTAQLLEKGQFVLVPFRNKKLIGIIWHNKSYFLSDQTREITQYYDYKLSNSFMSFLKSVADYNIIELGITLKMAINAFAFNINNIKNLTISSIQIHPEQKNDKSTVFKLSQEQFNVFEQLLVNAATALPSLLEGITGSGKTLVYLKLIATLLENGGQALILLPEIALTTQITQKFIKLLPQINILQWHSGLTPKQRKEIWQAAFQGQNCIIIGARSALFLPFSNLKIIVVDEEHDTSFKQEEGAIYNARDMAVLRCKITNIPVVLVSATPSIETIYNCQISRYKKVTLSSRYNDVLLPHINIIDMRAENLKKGEFISAPLRAAISENLQNAKQSLIFLNRKGYAPLTLCSKCGTKVSCPNCSSYLVLHKRKQALVCHYCGYKTNPIKKCNSCYSENIINFGPGIEKIEEELQRIFPNARIITATSETIANQKTATNLLDKINNHDIDVIIGTQILAKGFDFKLLQLVGVIDADCSYTSGDIRANERMYQLLSQVSGRAGRDKEQGQVFFQTYEPNNHILHSIIHNDQEAFFAAELADREISNTPPFSRIAVINIACKKELKLLEFAYRMSDLKPSIENLSIIGPSSAPLSLIKGNYRYRFILKAKKNTNLQKIIIHWFNQTTIPYYIKIKVDIDPYNFS